MKKEVLLELAKPNYTKLQLRKLEQAVELARKIHLGQKRLSGDPYITHPLSVAAILIEWRLDIDSVLAAVLHDTIEDGNGTLEEIELQFGKDVAFLVDGVTKVSRARSGMENLESYLPKTSDNLSKFLIAVSHDIRVLLIKLADRLHNLRTLQHLPDIKQKKIAQESLSVFAPLADRLGMGRVKIEIEEISFSYLKPKTYQKLRTQIKKRVGKSQKYLEQVRRDIATELGKQKIIFQIDGRIKSTYSLYKKLKKSPIDEIYDLMAIRIITGTKADCYRILGILHTLYQPMLKRIKDYISVPKPNGYQSLHTTVITPNEQIVEFQIRTATMHEFAERGLAASFHYNEQKLTKNYINQQSVELPRNLKWITALQDMLQKLQAGELPEQGVGVDIFSDRIFVYTPKGDILDLPEGATVLDFAFAVHSDIGEHAASAKINNKIARLSTELNNGDIVEITTRGNISPRSDWLEYVKTSKARQKIKAHIKAKH